jgi:hypothetical protein
MQYYQELTSAAVEKILFQQSNYIDENTSISTHQSNEKGARLDLIFNLGFLYKL